MPSQPSSSPNNAKKKSTTKTKPPKRHCDLSAFHQLLVMDQYAPTVPLTTPVNQQIDPPAMTPENLAIAKKENARTWAEVNPTYPPLYTSNAAGRQFGTVLQPTPSPPPVASTSLQPLPSAGEVPNVSEEVETGEAHRPPANRNTSAHPIAVTMSYLKPSPNNATQRKANVTKHGHVNPQTMTRNQFQEVLLAIHGLTGVYRGHPENGFSFVFSWFGIEGGRSLGPTIDDDEDWANAKVRLGKKADIRSENGEKLPLFATFDTTEMENFLVRTRGAPPVDAHAAVLSTRVPRTEHFTEADRVQGAYVMALRNANQCNKPGQHLEENGGTGACIQLLDRHIPFNMRIESKWAAALAAGTPGITLTIPPNIPEIDGLGDGRAGCSRPRGRTGPGCGDVGGVGTMPGELMPVLLTTLTATTASLVAGMQRAIPSLAPLPTAPTAADAPLPTVGSLQPPHTPRSSRVPQPDSDLSPAPAPRDETKAFLEDYLYYKLHNALDEKEVFNGQTLQDVLARLGARDITPDIIGDIPTDHLERELHLRLGTVLKLKQYATFWVKRLEHKRRLPSPEV